MDRFIPDSEVDALFRAADAVALPYRSATQSGVAQIALAFRKPLVLTRTGGLAELVEEGRTGFMADPCDPAGLAASIVSALELARDPSVEDSIARVARRFSWESYAASLLEALQ
jgi:glycosyltransferase involved in cell wall biosynthesis